MLLIPNRRPRCKQTSPIPTDPEHRRIHHQHWSDWTTDSSNGGHCSVFCTAPIQAAIFPENYPSRWIHHLAQEGIVLWYSVSVLCLWVCAGYVHRCVGVHKEWRGTGAHCTGAHAWCACAKGRGIGVQVHGGSPCRWVCMCMGCACVCRGERACKCYVEAILLYAQKTWILQASSKYIWWQ